MRYLAYLNSILIKKHSTALFISPQGFSFTKKRGTNYEKHKLQALLQCLPYYPRRKRVSRRVAEVGI